MPSGTIKWFNGTKGYGFIRSDSEASDVFVHRTAVDGLGFDEALEPGETVEFALKQTPKGLQAVDVRRVGMM